MRALMIIESSFGNVAATGKAIADGLRSEGGEVAVVAVADAPQQVPTGTDLLLVGAPPTTGPSQHLSPADSRRPTAANQARWEFATG